MRTLSRTVLVSAGCSLLLSAALHAEAQKERQISMITVGDVDSALRDRVAAYVKEQYGIAPVLGTALTPAPDSVGSLKQELVKRVTEQDVCLLALCALPAIDHQMVVFKEERCGAVNLTVLAPKKDAADRDETYGRRAEKESLRAIALMIDIPACPFPRCALKEHNNEAELDFKSRNPCPPCLQKIRNKLTGMGMTLAKDDVAPQDK